MAAARHQGPCVCGRSIGQHTKRAARRHREQFAEDVAVEQAVGVLAGITRAVYEAIVNREAARRFAGELESAVIEAAWREP